MPIELRTLISPFPAVLTWRGLWKIYLTPLKIRKLDLLTMKHMFTSNINRSNSIAREYSLSKTLSRRY